MKLTKPRYCAAAVFAASLIATPIISAQDRDDHRRDERTEQRQLNNKRYYDRTHKDYHQWNENEDRNYNLYLDQNHRNHRDWAHAKKSEQQRYWEWRHEHPDERR